jgi:hypothetical protein
MLAKDANVLIKMKQGRNKRDDIIELLILWQHELISKVFPVSGVV